MWGVPSEDRGTGTPTLMPSLPSQPGPQAQTSGIPGDPKMYTPGEKKDVDATSLYVKLIGTIVVTFGLTLFLENSGLFPTIVAANQQFKKYEPSTTVDGDITEDKPEVKLEPVEKTKSIIEDAKGGLEMVKKEVGNTKT